ncbi:MAG: hypothetical protein IPK82_22870 [Polyangiaceae bacterium]|nr:hypothetical protein [Polyangiaceae bacterium]
MQTNETQPVGTRAWARSGGLRKLSTCLALVTPMMWSVEAGAHPEPADELHVAVHAPGGKGCISGEKLKVAVQKKIGSGRVRKTVDVRIQTNDPEPGWTAEVAVAGKAGQRSVKTQSSCSELDDGLVLVVSMLVDPEEEGPPPPPPKGKKNSTESDEDEEDSWGATKPTQEEVDDSEGKSTPPKKGTPDDKPKGSEKKPEPVQNKPGQNKPGSNNGGEDDKNLEGDEGEGGKKNDDEGTGKDKDKTPKSDGKVQFGLGGSFVYTMGMAPVGLPGARAYLEWLAPTPITVEAGFTYHAAYSEGWAFGATMVQRQMEAKGVDLKACPANVSNSWLRMSGCAGVEATWVSHSSSSENLNPPMDGSYWPEYYSSEELVISPSAEVRLDLKVFSWLRARVGAGLLVPVNPTSWVLSAEFPSNQMMEPVIFQGQVGIQVVLPP